MNRADKAKQYLYDRLKDLKDFRNLEKARPSFFASITHFKNTTVPDLNRFKIFKMNDINNLGKILEQIEDYWTKAGATHKDIWHETMLRFAEAQAEIYKLISIATTLKVPPKYRLQDFITSNALIIAIIAVVISYLLNTFLK